MYAFGSKKQEYVIILVIWDLLNLQWADIVCLFGRFDWKSNIFDIPRPSHLYMAILEIILKAYNSAPKLSLFTDDALLGRIELEQSKP